MPSGCHMAGVLQFDWHRVVIFTESSASLQIVSDEVPRTGDQLEIIEDICWAFS